MRLFGLIVALCSIIGAVVTIGPQPYFDLPAFLVVIGGAAGYTLLKGDRSKFIFHFGTGAVYFGWLGTLIGLISITGDRFSAWGDVDKMGPALAVAMLTILYGYSFKLITIALAKDLKPVKE